MDPGDVVWFGARSRKVLLEDSVHFATVECKISDARLKGRRKRLRGSNAGVGPGTKWDRRWPFQPLAR